MEVKLDNLLCVDRISVNHPVDKPRFEVRSAPDLVYVQNGVQVSAFQRGNNITAIEVYCVLGTFIWFGNDYTPEKIADTKIEIVTRLLKMDRR